MLSPAAVAAFLADGFVALRGAVPIEVARACQDVIWDDLARRGVARDDQSAWTSPVVRVPCPEGGPFAVAGSSAAIWAACDQLIGPGRCWRRAGVGGTIPVRFPSEADPGDAGWHIEASYQENGEQRVNVSSRGRGLLALYLLTDVTAEAAPTRIRPGSHLDVPRLLAPAGDSGIAWTQAARLAAAASARRRTVLATGAAGDVFLCHPFLVHAASWPHRGGSARMIAQPAVALHEQLPLGDSPSPVEQAILAGLAGLPRQRRKGPSKAAISLR